MNAASPPYLGLSIDVATGRRSGFRHLVALHAKPLTSIAGVDDEPRPIYQHLVIDAVMIGRDQGGIILSKSGGIKGDRDAAGEFGMFPGLRNLGNVGIEIINAGADGLRAAPSA